MAIVLTNVKSALKNFYLHEMNREDEFKIDEIIKPVPVVSQSDNYYVFGDEFKVKNWEDYVLGQDADAKAIEPTLSTSTYTCLPFAAKTFVAKDKLDEAGNPKKQVPLMQNMMMSVIHTMKMAKELQGVEVLTTAANYATSNTYQGPNIADTGNSEPIRDFHLAAQVCKKPANTIAMSSSQATVLMDHPDFKDRIKSGIIQPDEDILSSILGLRVVIFDAKKDTTSPGVTESLSYIWPYDKIWVGYVDPNPVPAMQSPSFAYSFVWESASSEMGFAVRTWDDPNDRGLKGGKWIKLIHSRDMKIVGVDSSGNGNYGVLLTNVWDGSLT